MLLTRECDNVPSATGSEEMNMNRCTSYNTGRTRVHRLRWLLAPENRFARIRLECSVCVTSDVRA